MITIQNLTKTYHTKSGEVEALRGISAEIRDGDILGITVYGYGMPYAEDWRSCRYVTGIRKIEVLATTPNVLECPISSYASMNHAPLGRLVSDSNNKSD